MVKHVVKTVLTGILIFTISRFRRLSRVCSLFQDCLICEAVHTYTLPKQALYQTELRPDIYSVFTFLFPDSALSALLQFRLVCGASTLPCRLLRPVSLTSSATGGVR